MKKILSTLLAIVMIVGVFSGIGIPSVAAAPGANTNIYAYGGWGDDAPFEYVHLDGVTWTTITCPYWKTSDTGSDSFCLQSSQESPPNEPYRAVNSFSVYSPTTLYGIEAILLHGYPSNLGGLTEDQAHYATQLALWSWMYTSAGEGYAFYSPDRIRAKSGNAAVYAFYQQLLTYAANGDQNIAFGISVSPSTVVLNSVGGQLQGTATVSFNNLNGYYSIDQSKLPSGVTITPATGYNGQTLTITSTSAFNGQTMQMSGAVVGYDSRVPGNVFWYEPNDTQYQNMVTFDMNFQSVAKADLSFRVNAGSMSIIKTTQYNNGSVSGFTFEVRDGSGSLIGTYTTDTTGKIDIANLMPGTYSVKEVNLSTDFVTPATNPQSVTVNAGQNSSVSFDNIKKRGVLTLQKSDANVTLGGFSLAGAVYEVRDQGQNLVDTLTTDSTGKAQSQILPLGVYTIKEKTAPYGFQLDTTTYTAALSGTQGTASVVYFISSVVMPWHKPGQEYGDAPSYYDNSDGSLTYITENKDIYPFLYGEGWQASQQEMMQQGIHTPETYGEWAALQAGVLAQFEQTREILFDGQPFKAPNHTPTMDEIEADLIAGKSVSLMDIIDAQKNEHKPENPGKKPSLLGRLEQGKQEVAAHKDDAHKDAPARKPALEVD